MENTGKLATLIGPMIKRRRTELELSQKELATSLGYKYGNFIGMIETGSAKFPREAVMKFADALEISPEKFIQTWIKENQPDWLPFLIFKKKE